MKTRAFRLNKRKTGLNNWLNINEMNMTNTIEHSKRVNKSEIAVVAYHLWEKAGQPANRDLQFWLDAEEQLRAAAKAAPVTPAAHLSPVDSKNNTTGKAANVQFAPRQANSSKPQQNVPRF
jgi:DUF2934 family protein